MLLLTSTDLFKINFSKNYFRNTIRVSNGLDLDGDRHFVGPDLGLTSADPEGGQGVRTPTLGNPKFMVFL